MQEQQEQNADRGEMVGAAAAVQMPRLRIIISPAKKMNTDPDTFAAESLPVFLSEAEELRAYLQGLSFAEAKALWRCNDKLAELNFARLKNMELCGGSLTPALIAYEGIQYQYLAPKTLEEAALSWLSGHLRIVSGFYGLLRPFDGVAPYRLEMQAEAKIGCCRNLYAFWGGKIYEALCAEADSGAERAGAQLAETVSVLDRASGLCGNGCAAAAPGEARGCPADKNAPPLTILNLASKEYAKAVEPYLRPQDRWISCVFAERADGKLRQKATLAKMARGEMVRYLAETLGNTEINTETALLSVLKKFDRLGFAFSEAESDGDMLVFIHEKESGL